MMTENESRWRISLHEAGHAVAARRLLNDNHILALLKPGGGGVALCGNGGCDSVEDAIMLNCGGAAESLRFCFAPPELTETELSARTEARATGARLAEKNEQRNDEEESDWDKIRAWFKTLLPGEQDALDEQIDAGTLNFVRLHADEIVEVAWRIFCDGYTILDHEQ